MVGCAEASDIGGGDRGTSAAAEGENPSAESTAVDSADAETGGFRYTVPDSVDGEEALARHLREMRETARREFDSEVEAYRRDRGSAGPPPDALSHEFGWQVTGRHRDLIALSGEGHQYLGGAHGMPLFDALIWDRAAERPLEFGRLFTNRSRAFALIADRFCPRLAEAQRERGLDPAAWDGCPPLAEQTLTLQGEPGEPFTSVAVTVPPYVAGPYVAGSFEISIEVAPELIALVRPEFRDSFAAPGGMRDVSGGAS